MTAALEDDAHAREQRGRYAARRSVLREAFEAAGWVIGHSEAGLYLWAAHPAHDGWSAAELLAGSAGILVAPGELYGPAGKRHIRVALTGTDERVAAAVLHRALNVGGEAVAGRTLRAGCEGTRQRWIILARKLRAGRRRAGRGCGKGWRRGGAKSLLLGF